MLAGFHSPSSLDRSQYRRLCAQLQPCLSDDSHHISIYSCEPAVACISSAVNVPEVPFVIDTSLTEALRTQVRLQLRNLHSHHTRPMSANSSALKRKHSGKTIKELFTTHSKPNLASAAPLSPTSKRTRRDSSPIESTEVATSPSLISSMDTADMYSFPSKKAGISSNANVVHITSSPENSPAKTSGQRNGTRRAAPSLHSNSGPKRLVVKNFKPIRKVDPRAFLDQTWQKVEKALDTIFEQGDIDFSLEELYRGVENVCRQDMARDIKERLTNKCRDYVRGSLEAKVKDSLGKTSVDVLRTTLHAWALWNSQMVSRATQEYMPPN